MPHFLDFTLGEMPRLGSLLSTCERLNHWQTALHVLAFCALRRLPLSLACYHGALASCTNASEWQSGLAMLGTWQVKPDVLTSIGMAEAYHRRLNWQGANMVLDLERSKGFRPSYRLHSLQSEASSMAQAWAAHQWGQGGLEKLGSLLVRQKPNPPVKNFTWHREDPDEGKPFRLADVTLRLGMAGRLPRDLELGFLRLVFQPCLTEASSLSQPPSANWPKIGRFQRFPQMLTTATTGLGGFERDAMSALQVMPWSRRLVVGKPEREGQREPEKGGMM